GVRIYRSKGFDVINIRNSIDNSVLDTNPELKTTKAGEGHGFGIAQIRNITEKYSGMLDIYEQDGCFVINAVYPC
ncbi:MAG: GHKL domain-containing protein, partial [Acutalibacteraceae bacterium]